MTMVGKVKCMQWGRSVGQPQPLLIRRLGGQRNLCGNIKSGREAPSATRTMCQVPSANGRPLYAGPDETRGDSQGGDDETANAPLPMCPPRSPPTRLTCCHLSPFHIISSP
jgi:hypothetical protein